MRRMQADEADAGRGTAARPRCSADTEGGSKRDPTMTDHDFWSSMASFVSAEAVVVDRPKGSAHPEVPALTYPLD
jgi:hypothetical protein